MKTMIMAGALCVLGGAAAAAVDTDALIADLQGEGYSWIEVERGPTQIKVEAVKGSTKVETVYDIATGAVIETETERADADDMGRTGVRVRDSAHDFEGPDDDADDADDARDDDDGDDGDDDRDDDNDDDDNDDDDGDDDDGDDDNDGDDDGDDDDGDDD